MIRHNLGHSNVHGGEVICLGVFGLLWVYFYKLALLDKNCLFLLFFGKMQLTSCRTHTNISVYNALWLKVERGVFCISSKLFEVHTNARKKGNFQSCQKILSSVTLLKSSTCPLTGFFWLLSHVIYLKLTKVLYECLLSQA